MCLGGVHPLWTEFLTYACENITFSAISFADGSKKFSLNAVDLLVYINSTRTSGGSRISQTRDANSKGGRGSKPLFGQFFL